MFTAEQQKAIAARRDTLVAAGAGAGKTRTVVERCARLLLQKEEPVSIREILVVTFTEAAATEVRERIRKRLDEASNEAPADETLVSQIAYLDSAQISTLHSFCYTLVREHFFLLDIDPAISVMDEAEAQVLFGATLDEILKEHYDGKHAFSAALLDFVRENLNGWDEGLKEFVRKLHNYTQTRPNARGWFKRQLEIANDAGASQWQAWYREAVQTWCESWLPFLRSLPPENENAQNCAELLEAACSNGDYRVASLIVERSNLACWPKGKKGVHEKEFEKLFDEAQFLAALDVEGALEQDWEWARQSLSMLLQLAQQFTQRFSEAKRERSRVDFHDLEQFALELLWDEEHAEPTRLAREWRKRFKAVFVDEYQDINAAQDRIIRALSSDQAGGNRFLVGDIKQSIYRFRQGDPSIFRSYFEKSEGWETAWLADNFRSHEEILNFVNPFFSWLMKRELGGVDYDEKAALRFGESLHRATMKRSEGEERKVELHLRFKGTDRNDLDPEELAGAERLGDLEDAEHEARLVAARLREMKERGARIYDQEQNAFRPLRWSDMVVLLRSAANKVEIYAKAFAAFDVPLLTKRDAFYSTQEVLDVCSLLHVLDNPLQDIPLVAVLRSPMVGLTADDLAAIRIAAPKTKPFWRALNEFHETKVESPARPKIERFLARYHKWRTNRATSSLARRVEILLEDTAYGEWLLSQPRGQQRYANVQQLLGIARQFDNSRGESLYLFLRHLEELQDAVGDLKPATVGSEDAVSLMTVHQSKGLEFPLVAVADLGKTFNRSDLMSGLLLDEKYGICTMVKPPGLQRRYPSLPLWLARRSQRSEGAGEEMRVLYVALTRAQNHLLLFGTTNRKRATEQWSRISEKPFPQQVLRAASSLDWIGSFLTLRSPGWLDRDSGEEETFRYTIHTHAPPAPETLAAAAQEVPSDAEMRLVLNRISEPYQHADATAQAAKTSVTALRRRSSEADEESGVLPSPSGRRTDGAEHGVAMHTFLEEISLDGPLDLQGLRQEAEALAARGLLRPEQLDLVDFKAVSAFWSSQTGQELLARRQFLRREFPFTYRLSQEDVLHAGLEGQITIANEEFLVVQGVADLLMLGEREIWLIDFKSDALAPAEIATAVKRYAAQLQLYSVGFASIMGRPVTRRGIYFLNPREMVWL